MIALAIRAIASKLLRFGINKRINKGADKAIRTNKSLQFEISKKLNKVIKAIVDKPLRFGADKEINKNGNFIERLKKTMIALAIRAIASKLFNKVIKAIVDKPLRFGADKEINKNGNFIERFNEKVYKLFEKSKEDAGFYAYVMKPLIGKDEKLNLSEEKRFKMLHNVFSDDNKTVFDVKPITEIKALHKLIPFRGMSKGA